MKTHHSSDAHICGLSKGVQNCIINKYHIGQMQCFRTKISIPVTPLTHDLTSASILRYPHFEGIQKTPNSLLNVYCLPVDCLLLSHNFDSCD